MTELVLDETGFAFNGKAQLELYVDNLTGKRSFFDPYWRKKLNHYGSSNPKIGLFTVGLMTSVASKIGGDTYGIFFLRLLMGLLSAGCVVLFFHLIRHTGSIIAAWFAVFLLLINPVFRAGQVNITTDIPMLFFCLLSLLQLAALKEKGVSSQSCWKNILLFGVFAGLAIGCKLFASTLFPVFFVVVLADSKDKHRRALTIISAACAVSAAIFILSNPLFLQGFWLAINAMTTNHINSLGGRLDYHCMPCLKFLFRFPFALFHWSAYDAQKNIPIPAKDLGIYLAYILSISGLVLVIAQKKWISLTWLIGNFLLIGYVMTTQDIRWVVPKTLLLPTISIIWLSSAALDHLFGFSQKLFAKRSPSESK